jgi:hypothetical protein
MMDCGWIAVVAVIAGYYLQISVRAIAMLSTWTISEQSLSMAVDYNQSQDFRCLRDGRRFGMQFILGIFWLSDTERNPYQDTVPKLNGYLIIRWGKGKTGRDIVAVLAALAAAAVDDG